MSISGLFPSPDPAFPFQFADAAKVDQVSDSMCFLRSFAAIPSAVFRFTGFTGLKAPGFCFSGWVLDAGSGPQNDKNAVGARKRVFMLVLSRDSR